MRNLLALLACSCLSAAVAAGQPAFERSIAPILIERCLECHSGAAPKGRLDLTTADGLRRGGKQGAAVVAGQPEQSLLWQRVDDGSMPPKNPLPEKEKRLLHDWIKAGALWGTTALDPFRFTSSRRAGYDWWALRPVQRSEPPGDDSGWAQTGIDRFILAKLREKGLRPAPPAEPRTLVRRLYFDLIGLPPTPEEVEAFVREASGDRHAAIERLVDRLLANPHYGQRWARHWLDVVRFGESNGYEYDELRKNAWPYRDWVIRAHNRDMPYDEFVRLQIAGDVLRPDDPDGLIATGFLVAGGYDTVGQKQQSIAMKAVVRQEELEDMLAALGQTFLGLTVHCARCHDHKFDPVRQEDYYRLAACLAGVRHGERDMTPSDERARLVRALAEKQRDLERLQMELRCLDEPIRRQIVEERPGGAAALKLQPMARWDFTQGLEDQVGTLHAKLFGPARQTSEGLVLPAGEKGYAATAPLPRNVRTRTYAAWVRLANLEQRGGGVLGLQTVDSVIFDAIVFGEREPVRWLAGSNVFERTENFHGPAESEAHQETVCIALVYHDDGTIACYRNGQLYGDPYQANGVVNFEAGKSQVLFGLRHSPPGGNKHLAGTIVRAELYDRPLSAAEVSSLSGVAFVRDDEVLARLDDDARARRRRVVTEIAALRKLPTEPAKRPVYAASPATADPTHLLERGEPARKGRLIAPGGVTAIGVWPSESTENADEAQRRRELALWLTERRNPLFARVMVNRLWQYHFGAGIVDTPSDFGFNGGRPSHPELLDWLADEFVRQGYRLKAMHRLIVTSAAYQQASQVAGAAQARAIDVGNRLLWHKTPIRLEAEALRDSVLAVAGELNQRMDGPGYQDFDISIRGLTFYYTTVDRDDIEQNRRSIYRTLARSGRSPLLDTLDCPDPSTTTPRRALTTTPLQALALLNNSFLLRMADRFAARVRCGAEDCIETQIAAAYQLALGRDPRADELELTRGVVAREGIEVLCRALFNSNEFMYAD